MLRKAEVTVLETKDGTITIEHRGKTLTAVPYHKIQAKAEEVSSKELMEKLAEKGSRNKFRPGRRHPWKRGRMGFSQKIPELVCC